MGANRSLFNKKQRKGSSLREGKDKRFLMGANRSLFIKKAKIRELLMGGR